MLLRETLLPSDVEDAIVESILRESDSVTNGIRSAMALARTSTTCRIATQRSVLFRSLAADMRRAFELFTSITIASKIALNMASKLYEFHDMLLVEPSDHDLYQYTIIALAAADFRWDVRRVKVVSQTYSRWESPVNKKDTFRTWKRLELYFEFVPFDGAIVHVTTESWPVMQPDGCLSTHPVPRTAEFDIRLPDCDIIAHIGNLMDQRPNRKLGWWCDRETPCATMLRNLLEKR